MISTRSKGMPRIDGRGRGALHVVVQIEVPRTLSKRAKELLGDLEENTRQKFGELPGVQRFLPETNTFEMVAPLPDDQARTEFATVVVQEGGYDLNEIGRLVHETLAGIEEGASG